LDEAVQEELELLEGAGSDFDPAEILAGRLTPVYFGSALTNFGVEPFFDAFVDLAPPPASRLADGPEGEFEVHPLDPAFSAYIFKIQANMNPRHRDSTAFMRVCSGRFERQGMVYHHRLGKTVRLSRPHSLMAGSRETVAHAYPGDVVGVINPGLFRIGDTVSKSGGFQFKPLPSFQPEVFARVKPTDVSKRKAFDKGVHQFAEEGTVQIFERPERNDVLYGVCGQLQFDVLQYRLETEYKVKTRLELLVYKTSAWIDGNPKTFKVPYQCVQVKDREGRDLVLFRSAWDRKIAEQDNPDHRLLDMA
jgi:peptide chain release factor 3